MLLLVMNTRTSLSTHRLTRSSDIQKTLSTTCVEATAKRCSSVRTIHSGPPANALPISTNWGSLKKAATLFLADNAKKRLPAQLRAQLGLSHEATAHKP